MLRQANETPDISSRHHGHGNLCALHANPPSAADGKQLRVLMIVECSSGGTGRHVLDLAESLIERGCELHLIYSEGRIDRMFTDRLAEIEDLHLLRLPMR